MKSTYYEKALVFNYSSKLLQIRERVVVWVWWPVQPPSHKWICSCHSEWMIIAGKSSLLDGCSSWVMILEEKNQSMYNAQSNVYVYHVQTVKMTLCNMIPFLKCYITAVTNTKMTCVLSRNWKDNIESLVELIWVRPCWLNISMSDSMVYW